MTMTRDFIELPGTVLTDAEARKVLDELLTAQYPDPAQMRLLAVVISNLRDRVKALEAKQVAP